MDIRRLLLLVICIEQVLGRFMEIQRKFEFENVITDWDKQLKHWQWRSEATGYKTLRLEDDASRYFIEVYVCIEPVKGQEYVTLHLDDVQYSNDGQFDAIYLYFNGKPWSVYSTYEKWAWGHDWNIFRNTGRSGDPKKLRKGRYTIGFSVSTDEYGIELDNLRLIAEYQTLDSKLFCGGRLLDFNKDSDHSDFYDDS